VFRNRTYLGEVHFRDRWHPGTHLALKVTKPAFIGKGVIYVIRARKRPTVTKT